jgi:plastocyanin
MMKWFGLAVLAALAFGLAGGIAQAKDEKDKADKPAKVEIVDAKYKPAKVTVKKGQTVTWVNGDDRDHTVVSKAKEKDGGFDSGKIAGGDKFEHKFDKPGKYEYGCNYHPRMKGVVEVTE